MNDDDIEQLVRIAARESSQLSRRRLFRAIRFVEVFLPYRQEQHDGEEVRSTPLARLADGTHAMMLFTSKSHPHLSEHQQFAGATFKDALASALKMPSLDWVFLFNSESQRVEIAKRQISEILDDLDTATPGRDGSSANVKNGRPEDTLEGLISNAVESQSAELPTSIGSAIGDREIFLELSKTQAEDGQPVMKTFQIENLGKVVRAYTSRGRTDIRYGGIDWSELKNLIRISPEIRGVQIVNDADDWIVFDRQALGLNASTEP